MLPAVPRHPRSRPLPPRLLRPATCRSAAGPARPRSGAGETSPASPDQAGRKTRDIRGWHPVHLLPLDPGRQRIQRVAGLAPRPEPAGETREIRLADGVQHPGDSPLDNLVLQRRDAERPQPPVRLRDVHPPARRRPVTPLLHPLMQVQEISLQVPPPGTPRHPDCPRRGLRADRPAGLPQAAHRDMAQKRREPCLFIPYRYLTHTDQPTGHARPGTASGTCFTVRVPLGRSPFLPRLRSRSLSPGLVRQVRRYYGTAGFPRSFIPGLPPRRSLGGPTGDQPGGRDTGSPGSRA